ncbi:aldolase/citrate lyase family protein, partial [Alphaproteobacteria bacterium]|nr:aldolase/citrate lyase family protein [Alphaproteobacteria bacterium]
AGYDWVAVDMEHGSVGYHQLPDLFRALEVGQTLPLARLVDVSDSACKQVLDAGAGGVIIPRVETSQQLSQIIDYCRWPPAGVRGVGFSRANLYGKNFESYKKEAQQPLIVAMIESSKAVDNIDRILRVDGLDAIFIGPYDLSASLGVTGDFAAEEFLVSINHILSSCKLYRVPAGLHVINPSLKEMYQRIKEGYLFLAHSIDSVMLNSSVGIKLDKS